MVQRETPAALLLDSLQNGSKWAFAAMLNYIPKSTKTEILEKTTKVGPHITTVEFFSS